MQFRLGFTQTEFLFPKKTQEKLKDATYPRNIEKIANLKVNLGNN